MVGLDLHPLAVEQTTISSSGRAVQADIARLPLENGNVALLTALDSFDQRGVNLDRSTLQITPLDPVLGIYPGWSIFGDLRVSASAGATRPTVASLSGKLQITFSAPVQENGVLVLVPDSSAVAVPSQSLPSSPNSSWHRSEMS